MKLTDYIQNLRQQCQTVGCKAIAATGLISYASALNFTNGRNTTYKNLKAIEEALEVLQCQN